MHVIYILHLAENKFYVGKTALGNLENRVEQHKAQQGACAWTSLYSVQSLVHSYVTGDALAEDHETERLMLCYGIDNVRGGMYAEVCHLPLTRPFSAGLFASALVCRCSSTAVSRRC